MIVKLGSGGFDERGDRATLLVKIICTRDRVDFGVAASHCLCERELRGTGVRAALECRWEVSRNVPFSATVEPRS